MIIIQTLDEALNQKVWRTDGIMRRLTHDGLSPRLISAANEAQRLLVTQGRPASRRRCKAHVHHPFHPSSSHA